MSEEVLSALVERRAYEALWAEKEQWKHAAARATSRERTTAEAYNGQQTSYRELEALYQASQERALQAEAEIAELHRAIWIPQDDQVTRYCALCEQRYPDHYHSCRFDTPKARTE